MMPQRGRSIQSLGMLRVEGGWLTIGVQGVGSTDRVISFCVAADSACAAGCCGCGRGCGAGQGIEIHVKEYD